LLDKVIASVSEHIALSINTNLFGLNIFHYGLDAPTTIKLIHD